MSKEKRVPAEVYSRSVGYFRPISQWNKGKRSEFFDRYVRTSKEIEKSLEKVS